MVSVIIVSYNTEKLLRRCLASFFRFKIGNACEVIVVDNASTDGTVKAIQNSEFRIQNVRFTIIENKKNEGFGRAANKGASVAKGDYLLFLNSDAAFFDTSFLSMIDAMELDATIGAIGGRLENELGATSSSYGSFPTVFGVFRMLFLGEHLVASRSLQKKVVDWVSGGFMLVRTSLFKRLHGFDEDFFMYYEDVDLCYRIKQKGFTSVYMPKAIAVHAGQGSSNRTFAIVHIYKGLRLFMKKHKTGLQYTLVNILLLKKALLLIFFGYITRNVYLITTYKKALRA